MLFISYVRNVYVTMDNAKGNKCWTMFGGLAGLVAAGVCVKVWVDFSVACY